MAEGKTRLTISGAVNSEEVHFINKMFLDHGIPLVVEPRQLRSESGAFATPELLITASAIATVITFLFKSWNVIMEKKRSRQKDYSSELQKMLKECGCDGINVTQIDFKDSSKTNIVLNDEVEHRTIEIRSECYKSIEIRINPED